MFTFDFKHLINDLLLPFYLHMAVFSLTFRLSRVYG